MCWYTPDEDQRVSAAAVENTGAALIGLCVGRSLVTKRTPPQLILEASKQRETTHSAGQLVTLRPCVSLVVQLVME